MESLYLWFYSFYNDDMVRFYIFRMSSKMHGLHQVKSSDSHLMYIADHSNPIMVNHYKCGPVFWIDMFLYSIYHLFDLPPMALSYWPYLPYEY